MVGYGIEQIFRLLQREFYMTQTSGAERHRGKNKERLHLCKVQSFFVFAGSRKVIGTTRMKRFVWKRIGCIRSVSFRSLL